MINHHILRDKSKLMGEVLYELGNVYKLTGENSCNSTFFGRLLPHGKNVNDIQTSGNEHVPFEITSESLSVAEKKLHDLYSLLSQSQMQVKDAKLIVEELSLGIEMAIFAIDLTRAKLATKTHALAEIEATTKTQLIVKLDKVIQTFEKIWMRVCCYSLL